MWSRDPACPGAKCPDRQAEGRRYPFRFGRHVLTGMALILSGSAVASGASAQETAPETAKQTAADNDDVSVQEIVVQATRSGRRVKDEPIHVDVLDREEIEEKVSMRPGDIAMMLSETGGLRVQVTSPGLGGSDIRIQGLRGRYTQFLMDGLPLYGGEASSLGLLQIPPTDLGQVEIIKGAASALYGPSALGGVINLVSRRPSPVPVGEVVANVTSQGGQDLTGYASSPLGGNWSQSIVAGLDRQSRRDLNGDGWADIAAFERWTLRPRLFWRGDDGSTLFITLGAMGERRRGGTLPGQAAPDGQPFAQDQDSRRLDAGLVADRPVEGVGKLHVRASAVTLSETQQFGQVIERGRHDTVFSEVSVSGDRGSTSWLGGLAIQRDAFRSRTFPAFDYTYTVPAIFGQLEQKLGKDLTLAGSARLDDHSLYGARFSPRLSVLYRPGPWTLRSSVGAGFFAPTPFVEQIEASGLSRLEPLHDLKAETAETASVEGGYASGPLETSVTLFASRIHDAVQLVDLPAPTADGKYVRLANAQGETRTAGAEALLRYRWRGFTLTGSYVFLDATEPVPGATMRRTVPLTPRHSAGLVGVWERADWGRIGVEAYYTGRQKLEDDPYRSSSKPYFEFGFMAERRLGRFSLFLNLENLTDVRQTKSEPLLRPVRAPEGTWTVDVWGPTEGFNANAGIKLRFGGA